MLGGRIADIGDEGSPTLKESPEGALMTGRRTPRAGLGAGLIGCGSIAEVHAEALADIEGVRLVAAAGRSVERTRAFAERAGCRWTTDYRELLYDPEIDIIHVTTGSGSHARIAREALEAGKHVLVEKPLAMSSAEATALIRLAEERGLYLSVVSQTRYFRHHRLLKQAIDEGRLGRLLLIEITRPYFRTQAYYDEADWRGTKAEDGGALFNQGIHAVDLLLWLAGRPLTIAGRTATQTHRIEAEDMALALLTMEGGAFATIQCTTSALPGFPPGLRVYGEAGTVWIEGAKVTHWTVPGLPPPEEGSDAKAGGGGADPRSVPAVYHREQIADFLEAVRSGQRPAVTAEAGRDAVRLIELVHRSSEQGGMPLAFS